MGSEVTQFKKGEGGRPKGVQNKLTRTVKEHVLTVFNELQDDKQHNLKAFAKENPKEFYQIAAKLIPTEVSGQMNIIPVEKETLEGIAKKINANAAR